MRKGRLWDRPDDAASAAIRPELSLSTLAPSNCLMVLLLLAALALPSVSLAAKAPRVIGPAKPLDSYYPTASVRLGESGSVIVHFTLSADGQVDISTSAGEGDQSHPMRLIVGAERLLHNARFDPKTGRKRDLTARIVFQLNGCKSTPPSRDVDYNFDVCGQPQPPCLQLPQSAMRESGLKAAMHAILERGDLSDIDALSQALHLGLKLRSPKRLDSLVHWNAIATAASEYVDVSGFEYRAIADGTAGRTHIEIRFVPKEPLAPCQWGQEWKQKVAAGELAVADGPFLTSHFETVHWGGDDGITLHTDEPSDAILTQTIPRVVAFPERLLLTRHADTHLLERVEDVLLTGDLRDLRRVGELLHSELHAKEIEPDWLYGGLDQPLDDADSAHVHYELDDSGWGHWAKSGPCCFPPPRPRARTVDLSIAVVTDATCLSPNSVVEELDRRKAQYQVRQDVARRTYSVRSDNLISLTVSVVDSCIQTLTLHQVTDFRHDVSYPLQFVRGDVTHIFSERLTATGRAKIKALLWRLDRRKPCGIDLLLNTGENPLDGDKMRERRRAELVKLALIDGGYPSERIHFANNDDPGYESNGDPTAFVSVQESARGCSRP